MKAPFSTSLQTSINYLIAQIEVLSSSSQISIDHVKILFENMQTSVLEDEWPFNDLFPILKDIMINGLDTEKEKVLIGKLQQVIPSIGRPIGVPFDENKPIIFHKKYFCFTGIFELGSRKDCFELTASLGGNSTNNIIKNLDYLVIGKYCSPDWKHSRFGRKIEAAIRHNSLSPENQQIRIVSEDFFRIHIEQSFKVSS